MKKAVRYGAQKTLPYTITAGWIYPAQRAAETQK
jgi:hypothetical protein